MQWPEFICYLTKNSAMKMIIFVQSITSLAKNQAYQISIQLPLNQMKLNYSFDNSNKNKNDDPHLHLYPLTDAACTFDRVHFVGAVHAVYLPVAEVTCVVCARP